jgi:tRNA pseudouridine38-40 synthase
MGEEIHIHAEARSFLHNQIRNMVGSLRLIGNSKWSKEDLKAALLATDRTRGGETAPPQGLYLTGVSYKP